jgi:hypothetical protein
MVGTMGKEVERKGSEEPPGTVTMYVKVGLSSTISL